MISVIKAVLGLLSNRSVGVVAALALVVSTVVVVAVRADGSEATNVQLDDGSVWVTNQDRNLVGRLNLRIDELDLGVRGAEVGLDVLQAGRTVLFSGREGGVQRLDVLANQASGSNEIPITQYEIAGGVGAVYDPATGYVWIGAAEQLVAADYPEQPDAIVATGGRLVVTEAVEETVIPGVNDDGRDLSTRGRVLIVSASGAQEVPLTSGLDPLREGDDDPEPDDPEPGDPALDEADAAEIDAAEINAAEPDGDIEAPDPDPIFPLPPARLDLGGAEIIDATAVGATAVVLTSQNQVIVADGPSIDIPGDEARLQAVGPAADGVIVATDTGLLDVSLEGDVVTLIEQSGTPSIPVRVGECVYSAWTSETPMNARWCGPDRVAGPIPVPGAAANAELVWRVNQKNVALNSTGEGDVWADHDGSLAYVGNWSDVEPKNEESEDIKETAGEARVVTERRCIEGGAEIPITGDDQLGVRPRQSILDLLHNDDDFNCEPIAITGVEPQTGDWGALTIINDGQHVLFSPSDAALEASTEAIETFQFQYVVSDIGGNTSSPGTATVSIKDFDLGNSPPALRPKGDDSTREMRTVVEEGQAVSYNVIADWWDPDGDDLRLVDANPEDEGEVSATPDGLVRFSANGVTPGIHKVQVQLSDGISVATETLEVTVKPIGSLIPPVTSTDFVSASIGETVMVSPLANDSDPNEDQLSLRPLWTTTENSGYSTRIVGDDVEIEAIEAGVYELKYEANDGSESTEGSIRLEIFGPGDENTAPVAVPDQVKLRPDRIVNVDVLANDVDLDGDLLAVVAAEPAGNDPSLGEVRASVIDRRMVQVEVVPGPNGEEPTGPFTITYEITDGYEEARAAAGRSNEDAITASLQARGSLTVLVQPPGQDQPPILTPDEAVVRSGDIVSIPVLRNDIDPDSDELKLVGVDPVRAEEMEQANEGIVWIDERNVYVQGGLPGRYAIQYEVEAGSHLASTELAVVVKAPADPNENPNQPPEPADLTVRAIRDGVVRVKVPLTGVDPDGDSVVLQELGTSSEAASGTRVEIDPENPDTILYSAGRNAPPTDSFTYTVRDPLGLSSTAEVRVMVIDERGWPPQAHDDVWRGKPGRTLSIPVVANDSSPQDRQLEIAELPFFDVDGQPSSTPVNEDAVRLPDQEDVGTRGRIEVDVPVDGSTLSEHYRIYDGFNGSDAYIRVTPDENAPNIPPIAQPDVVTIEDLRDLDAGDLVPVPVLDNDFDPDDATSPLTYEVPAFQNGVFDGPILMVPLLPTAQTVLYRIADSDGDSTIGVARVPGKQNNPPVLSALGRDATARTIEAGSDAPLTIKIADITEDPDGDPDVRLTPTEVVVLGGLGEVRRVEDGSEFVFTPPANLTESTSVAIEFEVTDRPDQPPESWQEPTCNCLASLIVEVLIEASSPPRVVGQGAVSVPQLDEPVSYDVAPLIVDDQGDTLTYQFDSGSYGGLSVQQNGSVLTITSELSGDQTLAVGRSIPIRYTATDGDFEPVDNVVVVTIVATNKGKPATGALGPFNDVVRDETFSDIPNLLDAAVNPFAGDGRPLTLVDSRVSAGGQLTCNEQGDCEFTSSSTDIRSFTASYTVRDAVGQTATGSFVLTMKGLPLAPGVPKIESVGDQVANLSWSPADMQGGAFEHYLVTAVGTGLTKQFSQAGGEFDGLQNASEYTFTVAAQNEVGLGEVSAASSVGIPDRVPDPPVQLRFANYQDQTLSLEWAPPLTAGDFSAILKYEIQIGGQTIQVDGGTRAITVGLSGQGDPLQNGTDYDFRVRAQNSAKTDNGWGPWSSRSGTTERPSRFPDPPTNVSGVNSGDGGTPRVTVTWNAPGNDGGRAVTEFEVCRVQDGSCQRVGGSTTQATFNQSRSDTVSFTVRAFNTDKNRNNSDPSSPSPAVVAIGNPDPPTINSLAAGDKFIDVNYTPANNSGCSSATWEFSRNGGTSWQTSTRFGGLVNGQQYTIVGRTVLASSCGTPGQTYRSVNSNSQNATAYGPLVTPTISASGGGTTTITWNWNHQRADDGRPDWSASLSGDCGARNVTSQRTGSVSQSYTRDGTTRGCTITVSGGGETRVASASGRVQSPPPPPSGSTSKGGSANAEPVCTSNTCNYVNLRLDNYPPNSSVSVQCEGLRGGWTNGHSPGGTNSAGSFSAQTKCWHACAFTSNLLVTVGGVQNTYFSSWSC